MKYNIYEAKYVNPRGVVAHEVRIAIIADTESPIEDFFVPDYESIERVGTIDVSGDTYMLPDHFTVSDT